jgi:hypothetical protein
MGRSLVHDICAGSIATTGTPVNIIRFGAVCILTIELLTSVSTEAMNAVFTIAVTASYVAFKTPITTRLGLHPAHFISRNL